MRNFNEESVRNDAQKERSTLMSQALDLINTSNIESNRFYSAPTHQFLMEHGWEILIPAMEEEVPEVFKELHYDDQMPWPQMTNFCYVTGVVGPPSIPWSMLHFGYAVHENKLIRTAFFSHQKLVTYQSMPQGIVIDPLALQKGIAPDYYIGCPVCSKDYIFDFMKMKQNPLESYVKKEGHLRR
jgi:hypothetical protein